MFCNTLQSAEERFKLHYVPGDTTVDITLERLEVEEGARRTISKKLLNVVAPDIIHFVFNITRTPAHGTIDVLAPTKVDIVRANTTFFTSDEIGKHLLFIAKNHCLQFFLFYRIGPCSV